VCAAIALKEFVQLTGDRFTEHEFDRCALHTEGSGRATERTPRRNTKPANPSRSSGRSGPETFRDGARQQRRAGFGEGRVDQQYE
jgi:hypothetical protein